MILGVIITAVLAVGAPNEASYAEAWCLPR